MLTGTIAMLDKDEQATNVYILLGNYTYFQKSLNSQDGPTSNTFPDHVLHSNPLHLTLCTKLLMRAMENCTAGAYRQIVWPIATMALG